MADESNELSQDPEWQMLLQGFRDHFWRERVPAFQRSWDEASLISPTQWSGELKRHVHGLAGVAALVDLPEVGDAARHIDQHWDALGASGLPLLMQALSERLRALAPEGAA